QTNNSKNPKKFDQQIKDFLVGKKLQILTPQEIKAEKKKRHKLEILSKDPDKIQERTLTSKKAWSAACGIKAGKDGKVKDYIVKYPPDHPMHSQKPVVKNKRTK